VGVRRQLWITKKPYQVEVDGNEIFLINGNSGEKEYKIDFINLSQTLWPAVALNRDDKIKIPKIIE
jgi:hypothetical protein|tara:strand:+ start:875 stop:1072 length:198 start_codon:yes stop_codon:yes gene_type:complete